MSVCIDYLNLYRLESLTAALLDGLKAELDLTPKPGLVDLNNSGSHQDLNVALMRRSVVLMKSYLDAVSIALTQGQQWRELIILGQQAETRMFNETGTNCHRGGIFLCGLMLTAAARIETLCDAGAMKASVKSVANEFFRVKKVTDSHGNKVRVDFPAAGIVAEALAGLPAVFDVFLPALADDCIAIEYRPFLGMALLMQVVEDSTTLHRCGADGLAFMQKSGEKIEGLVRAGENPTPTLLLLDQQFQRMNMTMGGVADLLGIGLGYARYQALHAHPDAETAMPQDSISPRFSA